MPVGFPARPEGTKLLLQMYQKTARDSINKIGAFRYYGRPAFEHTNLHEDILIGPNAKTPAEVAALLNALSRGDATRHILRSIGEVSKRWPAAMQWRESLLKANLTPYTVSIMDVLHPPREV